MKDKWEKISSEIVSIVKKAFPGSDESDVQKQDILKSVDKDERRALFIAMEPDVYDAHGDITSAEEIEKACNNFNEHCMKANLFHLVDTEAVVIQQSFINLSDTTTDTGEEIKKGTWLIWMHFPEGNEESDLIWNSVKDNTINGISIHGRGYREEIE